MLVTPKSPSRLLMVSGHARCYCIVNDFFLRFLTTYVLDSNQDVVQ